jgi:hypothetical protein
MTERRPGVATRPSQPAVQRDFRPLPEGASLDQIIFALQEMASAYATIAAAYTSQLPLILEDLQELQVIQVAHGVRLDRLEIWQADQLQGEQALPPMRPRLSSTSDQAITKNASHEIGERVVAELKNTSTPPPDVAKVAEISADIMQIAIDRVKAQELDKRDAAAAAAEAQRVAIAKQAEADRARLAEEARLREVGLKALNAQQKITTRWAIIMAVAIMIIGVAREILLRMHWG